MPCQRIFTYFIALFGDVRTLRLVTVMIQLIPPAQPFQLFQPEVPQALEQVRKEVPLQGVGLVTDQTTPSPLAIAVD